MYLENLVFDAVSPRELGRFWEAALGTEPLTDEDEGYETRLAVAGGPTLDFESNGLSEDVGTRRIGAYAHAAVGVDLLTAGRVSGFIEGDGDFSGGYNGGGGRLGVRIKF